MKKCIFCFSLFTLTTFASEGLLAPGGIWWVPKSRIQIEKAVDLRRDTQWVADEVIINAPVVTNGNMLLIVARRLHWREGAAIRGFQKPLLPLDGEGPPYPSAAPAGAGLGANGSDGKPGKLGVQGNPGMGAEGALPKEIVIFAGAIDGKVIIDGTGQVGGGGGKGGRGQDGGSGAQGTKAICRALAANTAAGRGGAGGVAGSGGKGGIGGLGGAPVPFQLLTAVEDLTGERVPQWVCQPGAGGEGGAVGEPGQPGKGGPGGLADSVTFIFNLETEPGGPDGPDGAAADNSGEFKRANIGEKGSLATFSAEKWKGHVGRTSPNLIADFHTWEDARFQAALNWFEFHWWRLYERISRTSVALMVARDDSDGEKTARDPLAELIPLGFDREAMETISLKWNEAFMEPLRATLEGIDGRNDRLADLLKRVISSAELFTAAMKKAQERGNFLKSEVQRLKTGLESISAYRSEAAKAAVKACGQYTKSVLQNEDFQRRKEILFGYFEIPACADAAEFLVDSGVQRPIELALEYSLQALPAIEGVVATEKVDADIRQTDNKLTSWLDLFFWGKFYELLSIPTAWAAEKPERKFAIDALPLRLEQLRPAQVIEFLPKRKAAVVTGSLGLHKGYRMPETKWDLATWSKELVILRKLIQGERP